MTVYFYLNESHLGAGATKEDALNAIWELEGLGWDVQYGDSPTWKEVLASDPEEMAAFEEDLKQHTKPGAGAG